MDASIARLFTANSQWAAAVRDAEPDFFETSALGQAPKVLWIGCSDSRVPESVITASKPGDIFTHRNVANQFQLDDISALAVLTYAVMEVGVDHVVIVGHSNCGGAAACHDAALAGAASADAPTDPLGRWLTPLIQLAASLNLAGTERPAALGKLVDANVRAQVENLVSCDVMKKAWEAGKTVRVHGLVYDLASGKLNDLGISQGPPKA